MKTTDALQRYTEMMIQTIEGLRHGWRKTWIDGNGMCMPMNADGKRYNGMNAFLLMMLADQQGWELPIFVTFNRCKQMGAHVCKGEKAVPVFFFKMIAKSKTGDYVDADSDDADGRAFPVLRCFDVFNVEQTTLKQDAPEQVERWRARYKVDTVQVAGDDYQCELMERMISGGWLCPIKTTKEGQAYYAPKSDEIHIPERVMFNGDDAGMEYYAAALHEMAHSTGHDARLARDLKGVKGGKEYGREELVAELTAAVVGQQLGFSTGVQENNAAYLKGWLKTIGEQPKFLLSVLSDVGRAADMIMGELEK